jgi:hypothetical protein
MKATITHTVDCSSIQKATALRDAIAESLGQEVGVSVINSGVSKDTTTYRVLGYDIEANAKFEQEVEAEGAVEAQDLVESDDMRVVKVEEV